MHHRHFYPILLIALLCAFGVIAPVLAQQTTNGPCGGNYNYTNGNRHMTSDFGPRQSQQGSVGATSSFHKGVDIRVKDDQPPTANSYMDGVVIQVDNQPGGYGKFVIVQHANGLQTVYGHASETLVTEGQIVTAGQALGDYSGACTGNCTGPHIHYETRVNIDGVWTKVDPAEVERVVGMGYCPDAAIFSELAMGYTAAKHGVTAEQLNSGGLNFLTLNMCTEE